MHVLTCIGEQVNDYKSYFVRVDRVNKHIKNQNLKKIQKVKE